MFQMTLMREIDDGIVADASIRPTERKRSKERRLDDLRDYPHKTKTFEFNGKKAFKTGVTIQAFVTVVD